MFKGSFTALVTPFTDQGGIDLEAFDRLLDFQLEQGSDGLVVAGTTGESAALLQDEFAALLDRAVERVDGRVPVIAGTGGAATGRTLEQTLLAADLGADAALVVTPYYVKPPQRGLLAHFSSVAEASPIPVVLYNVPGRTSVDMLPETVAALSEHPNIAGIKEAVGDPGRVERLVELCPQDFCLLSGDDPTCLASMKLGMDGVISVAANAAAAPMHAMCAAALKSDWAEADRLNERLAPFFTALALETNPIPVKWAVYAMGLAGSAIRLPLAELDEQHHGALNSALQDLGLIPG
jgi:4-hydroxy-tetrahydrodipicolinate synthase